MKVKELIEFLSTVDQDAEILINKWDYEEPILDIKYTKSISVENKVVIVY